MKISQGVGTLAVLALVVGCTKGEVILPGERLDVRAAAMGEDPATALAQQSVPIALPAAVANADWTQRGGNALHRSGNLLLSPTLTQVWAASIGSGDRRKNRITASPVVAGGRIFTLDAEARVTATGTNGTTLWQADLTPAADRSGDASGGGLAAGEGLVFAATGFGELVALDPATGGVVWRQKVEAAIGGAPAVSDGKVFIVARDDAAWAVRAADGKVEWILPGTPSGAGVAGVSAPAVDQRQVVYPFSSGQMIAVAKDSGTGLWQAHVAGKRRGRAYATVSDLTGDPVIADGIVYAGTSAGRFVAINADTGQPVWSAPDGALSAVSVAGGSVFLVNDEDQLMRMNAATGEEVWRVDLPYFTKDKEKRRKAIHAHYGPVLAGGRLVIVSSDGLIRSFDPASGALVGTSDLPGGAAVGPAIAGGVLYVVTKDGKLRAFR